MSRIHLFALAGLGVATLSVSLFLPKPVPAQDKAPADSLAKWEYKVVYENVYNEKSKTMERVDEKKLNELGAEGWDLCGVVGHVRSAPVVASNISSTVYFVFKR